MSTPRLRSRITQALTVNGSTVTLNGAVGIAYQQAARSGQGDATSLVCAICRRVLAEDDRVIEVHGLRVRVACAIYRRRLVSAEARKRELSAETSSVCPGRFPHRS